MAKQTREQKVNELKKIGIEINTDFVVSKQAQDVIDRIDDFPVAHFKAWWTKHYGVVNGQQLHHYLSVEDGLTSAPRSG